MKILEVSLKGTPRIPVPISHLKQLRSLNYVGVYDHIFQHVPEHLQTLSPSQSLTTLNFHCRVEGNDVDIWKNIDDAIGSERFLSLQNVIIGRHSSCAPELPRLAHRGILSVCEVDNLDNCIETVCR